MKDVDKIKFEDSLTFGQLKEQFYNTMKKHGLYMFEKNDRGTWNGNTIEWITAVQRLNQNFSSHFNIDLMIGCREDVKLEP